MRILTIAAVAFSASFPAAAQVYKCTEGGVTVYSQVPCSPGAAVIDATPAAGSGEFSGAARARRDVEYLRERERREEDRRDRLEARREIDERYDRRIREIDERYDNRSCSVLQAQIERYEARLRAGARARDYEYYKGEIAAAKGRYSRECK